MTHATKRFLAYLTIVFLSIFNALYPINVYASCYCDKDNSVPPFLAAGATSNLLLMIDNSASMYDLAYVGEQGYCHNDSYSNAAMYAGYFETGTWYVYSFTSEKFEPVANESAETSRSSATYKSGDVFVSIGAASNVTCFGAKGNLLNWATASKFDIEKKILTGGKYVNNQLVMESRGCLGKRFVKKIMLQDKTGNDFHLTLGIRGSEDDTTLIEIFNVTTNGFNNTACQDAINKLNSDNPNQGQIKRDIEDCMGYKQGQSHGLANYMAAFNHSIHNCWYVEKHDRWPPGAGPVQSIKPACESVYVDDDYGKTPETITPDDRGYVCYGKYDTGEGYVGRCWKPASPPTSEVKVKCDGEPECPEAQECCGDDGFVWYCAGYKRENCPGDKWVEKKTGGGPGTEASWVSDECIEQALKDYCGYLEIPEVIDPTDQADITGELWNIPAVLIDSGVLAQLNEPLAVLKGYIAQADPPSGILHEFANDIRIGVMIFNDDGSDSECDMLDPHILYNCDNLDNRDGGKVVINIGENQTDELVIAINAIKATSWTPLSEAMYNAIGYYTQNANRRIDSNDFEISVVANPIVEWCQFNNILIVTEGGSTADLNSTVRTFTISEGKNDGITDDADKCGSLSGSTLLDDLTWYANQGANIYDEAIDIKNKKRNIKTHIVVAGDLRDTKTSDECNPKILLENAAKNGGTSLYNATNPAELEKALRDAFNAIRAGAAAGSAASVISASRGGEGAVYQAIFWPSIASFEGNDDPVTWTGEVHALLVDAYGAMHEDTNENRTLNDGDLRVFLYYDEANGETKGCYGDLNDDGTCAGTSKKLNEVKYLWSAGNWLSEINNVDILINRSEYISNEKRRRIFTWDDLNNDGAVDNSEIIDFTVKNNWLTFTVSGGRSPVPLDFGVQTSDDVNKIVRWIRGEEDIVGMRNRKLESGVTWRLGDVVHSMPVAVASPAEAYHLLYRDFSYAEFVHQYQKRRHVIYFGGNDGMMHAVNGGFYNEGEKKFCKTSDCESEDLAPELGAELWAYVPYNLLPHLKCSTKPDYKHRFYVDQRPRIFDVQIFADDEIHKNGWGTILVGGMMFGGSKISSNTLDLDENGIADYPNDAREFTSAYFIFDITDPEIPPVLLGEMTYAAGNIEMGYTTGIPTVIPMKEGSDTNWYLVLGTGPTELNGISDKTPKIAVFPLNLLTDTSPPEPFRIHDIAPASDDERGVFELTASPKGFVSDIITVDFDLNKNYKADVVYFGTVEGLAKPWSGKLYRLVTQKINESGEQEATKPSDWSSLLAGKDNPNILINTNQPITAAASVGMDGKNYWVFFGTGRFFDPKEKTDANQQTYYGIKEPRSWALDENDKICKGTFTWETVTTSDLLQVDQILVEQANTAETAILSGCLPTNVKTFEDLVNHIAGTGTGCEDVPDHGMSGWYKNFTASRERNLGQATLLGGLLTFTTYQPFEDICLPEGLAFLYSVFYQTGTAWYQAIFVKQDGTGGLDEENKVIDRIGLGRGLAKTPNLHVGKGGSKAFIQTSTGTIMEIPQPVLPFSATSGRTSWGEFAQ